MAKSKIVGGNITDVEVTGLTQHGFWLYVGDRELFVSFREFPWFTDASIKQLMNVRWPSPDHLHWPDLDIDVSIESIEHPERFPLHFEPELTKAR
jgi:hypothetical protein